MFQSPDQDTVRIYSTVIACGDHHDLCVDGVSGNESSMRNLSPTDGDMCIIVESDQSYMMLKDC